MKLPLFRIKGVNRGWTLSSDNIPKCCPPPHENYINIYKVEAKFFGLFGRSKKKNPSYSASHLSRSQNLQDIFLVPQSNLCLQRQWFNLSDNWRLKPDLSMFWFLCLLVLGIKPGLMQATPMFFITELYPYLLTFEYKMNYFTYNARFYIPGKCSLELKILLCFVLLNKSSIP